MRQRTERTAILTGRRVVDNDASDIGNAPPQLFVVNIVVSRL